MALTPTVGSLRRRRWCGATGARARGDGAVAGLHVCAPVVLVFDLSCVSGFPLGLLMVHGACSLELAKDFLFMIEEVAYEAVGVTLVHGERGFGTGTKDTGCEGLGEGGNVGFVCRGKLDEAGEVGGDRVEGSNVCETELAKGILEDRNAGLRRTGGVGRRVDSFNDFVNLG